LAAEGAKRAGRNPSEVDVSVLTDIILTDDLEAEMDHLRPRCLIMAGGEYSLEVLEHYGLTLEEVEPLREAVRKGDRKKALSLVTPAMANTFCIVGDSSTCLEKVRALERSGLTHLIATAGLRKSLDFTIGSMETYAEHVMEPYHRGPDNGP
jgi:alkanesulfonate monooxygenase SsuD/methylene tetrahydromethanopterin reductase-like flavin-dependent oxidoreductase (luciferase family)